MTCNLTDEGNSRSEELLRTESLYEEIQVEDNYKSKTMEPWAKYVLAALKAKELFVENKDYILRRCVCELAYLLYSSFPFHIT